MPHRLRAAARTHQGRRANNEDACLADLDHRLFIVADGMGGYEGGEVASRIVVDSIRDFFVRNEADADATWPWGLEEGLGFVESLLVVAVRLANREVIRRRFGHLREMGSTVVVATTDGEDLVLGHIGDSRIYRLRGGVLEQLTRDHSLVEELRASGMREHPRGVGHIITRAIGFSEATRPDVRVERLEPGDTLLLCSDGVTDPLGDPTIAALLAGPDPDGVCDALVRAAYEAGGTDNITAVVLRVEDEPGGNYDPRG